MKPTTTSIQCLSSDLCGFSRSRWYVGYRTRHWIQSSWVQTRLSKMDF